MLNSLIFLDLRRGWWKVTDENQLYQVLECLHTRGVREKELKRILSRYMEDNIDIGGKVKLVSCNLWLFKKLLVLFYFTLFLFSF